MLPPALNSYLLVVLKAVSVSLRALSLERSTARAFVVPFGVLSHKKKCYARILVPLYMGEKN